MDFCRNGCRCVGDYRINDQPAIIKGCYRESGKQPTLRMTLSAGARHIIYETFSRTIKNIIAAIIFKLFLNRFKMTAVYV